MAVNDFDLAAIIARTYGISREEAERRLDASLLEQIEDETKVERIRWGPRPNRMPDGVGCVARDW